MFEDIPSSITTSIEEIKQFYAYNYQTAKCQLSENPTDRYRVDKHNALGYFGIFPKWKEKINQYLNELHKKHTKFSYVDVCGRASGYGFGASFSYLFSLKTDAISRAFHIKTDIFVDGNLFDPYDFSRLVNVIKEGEIAPAFITFMPMAGLQSYTPSFKKSNIVNHEPITYIYLGKKLSCLIRLLRPGGYMMLERPFQFDGSMIEAYFGTPQNKYKLSMAVKKIVRKLKCRVEIISDMGGPYFLIHKPM